MPKSIFEKRTEPTRQKVIIVTGAKRGKERCVSIHRYRITIVLLNRVHAIYVLSVH